MTLIQEGRQFSFERLEVWQLALEALVLIDEIIRALPPPYGELAKQLRDASLSVVANIAEGVGKDGRDQLRFFRIARGSAYESGALIEGAYHLRLTSAESRGRIRERLLSVASLLTRMLRVGQ